MNSKECRTEGRQGNEAQPSLPSLPSVPKWMVTYRGFPLCFENDPYRQMFRIVTAEKASKFPHRDAALATAREYHAHKPPFAIEPLNP